MRLASIRTHLNPDGTRHLLGNLRQQLEIAPGYRFGEGAGLLLAVISRDVDHAWLDHHSPLWLWTGSW